VGKICVDMDQSWNSSAAYAVAEIFDKAEGLERVEFDHLRQVLDKFIESLYGSPGGAVAARRNWIDLGSLAVALNPVLFKSLTVAEVTATLIRKQKDYGPENIRRFGRQGILVRMHDKVARLENLLATGRVPSNESVEDTYLDIVGYAAIGVMWEAGTFLLPLE
jgi:hypothetical protein